MKHKDFWKSTSAGRKQPVPSPRGGNVSEVLVEKPQASVADRKQAR